MKLRYAEAAIRQLSDIKAYISKDNPQAARRVVAEIRSAVNRLLLFPEAYRPQSIDKQRTLIVPRLPYIVVYRIGDDRIDGLGVFHAARDPAVWS